jgi:hypothetical protein
MAKEIERALPALFPLAQAYDRFQRGEPLDSVDRHAISRAIELILGNADTRRFYYTKVPARAAHREWVCWDFLLHPDRAKNEKKARGEVAEAWRLADRTVREIVDELGVAIEQEIAKTRDPDAMRGVIKWHRERYLAGNSRSSPKK